MSNDLKLNQPTTPLTLATSTSDGDEEDMFPAPSFSSSSLSTQGDGQEQYRTSYNHLQDSLIANCSNEDATMSQHKLDEVQGQHLEEPLLMNNERRFVLFPIQEPDVGNNFSFVSIFIFTSL